VSRGIATMTLPGIHLRNICVTSPQRSEQTKENVKRVVSTAVNWISDPADRQAQALAEAGRPPGPDDRVPEEDSRRARRRRLKRRRGKRAMAAPRVVLVRLLDIETMRDVRSISDRGPVRPSNVGSSPPNLRISIGTEVRWLWPFKEPLRGRLPDRSDTKDPTCLGSAPSPPGLAVVTDLHGDAVGCTEGTKCGGGRHRAQHVVLVTILAPIPTHVRCSQ
jgi:hypothetical protein